ncbi:MAG: GatB/YqeY domain-containing protein [Sulfurospirillum sp.]|nr:GatB/YqeY domain-containing protein [Sulfurospirillum sp.]
MSDLKEKLKADLKVAMLAKDTFTRDTIRFLMSAIKQIEVDERKDLSDEDIQRIIQKSLKQREDAAAQFKAASRDDLYDKEIAEAKILQSYLPEQLSDAQLQSILETIIKEYTITSLKEMGKLMPVCIAACEGRADGKRINNTLKTLLA